MIVLDEVADDLRGAGDNSGIEVLIGIELAKSSFINQQQPIENAVLAHQILWRRHFRLFF